MNDSALPDIHDAIQVVLTLPNVTVAWSIRLPDGQILEHQADRPMEAGSTFKAIVAAETCRQVEQGGLRWEDELVIGAEDRVPASAVSESLPDGSVIPLVDAVRAMLAVSDNTATDLVLRRIGHAHVVRLTAELGLSNSRVPVSVKDVYAQQEGEEFFAFSTTMRDLRTFYDAVIEGGMFYDPATTDKLLELLQEEDMEQGTSWPNGATCYRKSGSLELDYLVAQGIAGAFVKDERVATFALSANRRPGALDDLGATYTAFSVGFGQALKAVTHML